MSLEEYEILGILGNTISCSSYKVQNKITKTIFVWHAVNCSHLKLDEKQHLLKKLNERKSVTHPHFLCFHNYIEHPDSKVLYISTDFHKNGSLKQVIQRCNKNGMRVCEEFIIRIIYQISFTFKTSRNTIYSLKLEDIFLDDDHMIKLLNFDCGENETKDEVKMVELIKLISQICTTKINYDIVSDLTTLTMYSKNFRILLNNLLDDIDSLVSECVDKILCHPTILLKSSQWTPNRCFFKNQRSENDPIGKEHLFDESNNAHLLTQKLRKWELSLKLKESQLKEREHHLAICEKKMNLLEKSVKEKLTQAELYLKRCRYTKSTSSDSTKSSQKSKKNSYENLDTSYAVICEDSVIIPTSTKLNIEKLPKPSSFIRTFSERKVRFKGHSPLKEIDYNRRRTKPKFKAHPLFEENPKTLSESNSGKSSASSITTGRSSRISKSSTGIENAIPEHSENRNLECRPISWTEESKRQAFELLRIMNNAVGTQHLTGDVKHTYL